MENTELKPVCKLIKKYKFERELQNNKDLLCVICDGLLKCAYKSFCSCTYCYECFQNYTVDDAKTCPGRNCNKSIFDVMDNMEFDEERNARVLELVVQCPIDRCEHREAMRNMDKHIEEHQCFANNDNENYQFDISLLQDDVSPNCDCKVKMRTINELRNDIEELRDLNAIRKREDIHDYGGDILHLQRQTGDLKRQNGMLVKNIETVKKKMKKLDTESVRQQASTEQLQRVVAELQPAIDDRLHQVEAALAEWRSSRDKAHHKQDDATDSHNAAPPELPPEASDIAKPIGKSIIFGFERETVYIIEESGNKTLFNRKEQIHALGDGGTRAVRKSTSMDQLQTRAGAVPKPKDKLPRPQDVASLVKSLSRNKANHQSQIEPGSCLRTILSAPNASTFDWKVHLGKKKVDHHIYSPPLYSHSGGYKMNFIVFPDDAHLCVGFRLVKGNFDDRLSWPLNCSLKISLVDHVSGQVATTHSVALNQSTDSQGISQRPDNQPNSPYKVPKFFPMNQLFNDARLYQNGSVVLKYAVFVDVN